MYIKKVVEYQYNYAEYIVTDGKHDITGICMSVPLPNGLEPKVGMEITEVYVFNINELKIKKIDKEKESITKTLIFPLEYKITGKLINLSTIEVFGFKFSLYDEVVGFNSGDYVEVHVDRFDFIVENYY